MTEITQADREAAAVFYGTWGGTKGWQHLEEPIREGLVDDNALVRAFACHRMKANETQAREIERLREALQWMVDNDETNEGDEPIAELGGKSWDEINAYWIDGLNRARAALAGDSLQKLNKEQN